MRTWMFFLIAGLIASCSSQENTVQEISEGEQKKRADYYTEPYRPQFHFSPESSWMNDPNGMFYFEGQYHLFYQYNPDSTVWGPMHWGHAISKDMIEWEHKPIAIYPSDMGFIFSGSVVIDRNNTSGLGTGDQVPIVAIFTYDLPTSQDPTTRQYQGLAYSLDGGETFTPYETPILLSYGPPDFRDPKVFWHENTQKWIMSLAVTDHIEFYGSSNLLEWELLSEFGAEDGYHLGVWECPDLVQLPIEGSTEKQWVLLVSVGSGGERGSATQYFVGDFDGKTFTNKHYPERILWLDHGRDNYAGVTWSGIPQADGRKLFLGWMSNWNYANVVPTSTWRSNMTLPRTLTIFETIEGLRVRSYPVEESKLLRKKSLLQNRTIINVEMDWTGFLDQGNHRLDMEFVVTKVARSGSWEIVLSNDLGEELRFGYDDRQQLVYVDRSKSGVSDFSELFAGRHEAPRLSRDDAMPVRVVIDETSIELFADVGEVVLTELFFPTQRYNKMKFRAPYDEILLTGEFFHLESIW